MMFSFPKSLLTCGVLFFAITFSAPAQTVKIGVVDQHYIASVLQVKGSIQLEQQKTEIKVRKEIESLNQDLMEKQRLSVEYKKKGNQASSESTAKDSQQLLASIEAKTKDLQNVKLEASQSNAQKILIAIQTVAREKGYTSVLEVTAVPYYQDNDNISSLVLQKLGVSE